MPRSACEPGHRAVQGLWEPPASAEKLPAAHSPAWHICVPGRGSLCAAAMQSQWAANSHAKPSLITSQGCSQSLMTLCLRSDQLFLVTMLRPMSWGQPALAASRCWQVFAWVTSSGPCHSSPPAWSPLWASVPSPGLCRALAAQKCGPKPALLPTPLSSRGWLMKKCTDRAKKSPEVLHSACRWHLRGTENPAQPHAPLPQFAFHPKR